MLTELRTRAIICSSLLVGGVGCVLRRSWVRQVTFGSGRVEDERSGLGVFLFGDCWEGAEELVGDIGEDGGAARGDFVLREEEEQARQEIVDLGGGGEVVEVGGEGGGDFGGVGWGRCSGRLRVLGAERLAAEADQAATHAVGEAMVAASGVIEARPVFHLPA